MSLKQLCDLFVQELGVSGSNLPETIAAAETVLGLTPEQCHNLLDRARKVAEVAGITATAPTSEEPVQESAPEAPATVPGLQRPMPTAGMSLPGLGKGAGAGRGPGRQAPAAAATAASSSTPGPSVAGAPAATLGPRPTTASGAAKAAAVPRGAALGAAAKTASADLIAANRKLGRPYAADGACLFPPLGCHHHQPLIVPPSTRLLPADEKEVKAGPPSERFKADKGFNAYVSAMADPTQQEVFAREDQEWRDGPLKRVRQPHQSHVTL